MDGSVILIAERMWNIAALGNVGKRLAVNEDVAVLIDLETGWTAWDDSLQAALTSPNVVFGVFDGTGSADPKMAASYVAAQIFCEQMGGAPPTAAAQDLASAQDLAKRLSQALQAAGREVGAVNQRKRVSMGTTATVAAATSNRVVIAHVGDSRAYLSSDGQVRQVTRDDSLVNDLLDQGKLTAAEIETFPHRGVVTRVLGFGGATEHALTSLSARAGDVVLVCTEGIWRLVDDATIAALLRMDRDPAVVCRALVDAAEDAGGYENETAVVAMFDERLRP